MAGKKRRRHGGAGQEDDSHSDPDSESNEWSELKRVQEKATREALLEGTKKVRNTRRTRYDDDEVLRKPNGGIGKFGRC